MQRKRNIRRSAIILVLLASALSTGQAWANVDQDPAGPHDYLAGRTSGVTFTVNSTADPGTGTCDTTECTLREAITEANSASGPDTIVFDIPGSGVRTIILSSALPVITSPVTIDGYTQAGASVNTLAVGDNAVLLIELDGEGAIFGAFEITAGDSTVRGLVINRFNGNGATEAFKLRSLGNNTIQGNFVGTNAAGDVEMNNSHGSIYIENSPGNLIGGTDPAARNILLGNGSAAISAVASSSGGAVIQGNYINTNAQGTEPFGLLGIQLGTPNNLIGGSVPGARNVISGKGGLGILLSEALAHDNTIQGNYINVTADGNSALSNSSNGISIIRASGTIIGGTAPEARNVIASTESAVSIAGGGGDASNTLIQGNYLGTNAAGTEVLPPGGGAGSGVASTSASNTIIGGSAPGAGNVIAGWASGGILIYGNVPSSTGNVIQGNFIGTNAAGTGALPNNRGIGLIGITGGPVEGAIIGGTTANARNVIAGNMSNGILIAASNNTTVQGNYVGVAADGAGTLGNSGDGIVISAGSGNTIGGTAQGAGNIVAYSGANSGYVTDGVHIVDNLSASNVVRGNSIYANGSGSTMGTGINLGPDEVTANDVGDGDIGPNSLQNFPVVTDATSAGGSTVITGTLNSTPATTFNLDFYSNASCDVSGNGEGETFLGSTTVTTDASGDVAFNVTLSVAVVGGRVVTATATDPTGNTSEFSACHEVISSCILNFSDVVEGSTFYPYIKCLLCRGIVSGYSDGTFRPSNNVIRGQIAKIVSNSAGFYETITGQTYQDVIPSNTFYVWIERLSRRGHMNGYPCGQPGEPCIAPDNRPYFRPGASATRGQLSKIVANAAGLNSNPSGQFYSDVPSDNTFYVFIMRLTELDVMGGYACGGINPETGEHEVCDGQNRPYFRWANFISRGQTSKIVANTFFPDCQTRH